MEKLSRSSEVVGLCQEHLIDAQVYIQFLKAGSNFIYLGYLFATGGVTAVGLLSIFKAETFSLSLLTGGAILGWVFSTFTAILDGSISIAVGFDDSIQGILNKENNCDDCQLKNKLMEKNNFGSCGVMPSLEYSSLYSEKLKIAINNNEVIDEDFKTKLHSQVKEEIEKSSVNNNFKMGVI